MWQATAQDWSKTVRLGVGCYMYKQKGCKQDLSNYCVIMLLSVLSQAVRSLVVLQLSDSNPGQKGLDGCTIFSGDLEPTDGALIPRWCSRWCWKWLVHVVVHVVTLTMVPGIHWC